MLVSGRDVESVAYMDLPYGLALPKLVAETIGTLSRTSTLEEVALGDTTTIDKKALMRHYKSQYRATRRNARRAFAQTMRGGERFWRVASNPPPPGSTPSSAS